MVRINTIPSQLTLTAPLHKGTFLDFCHKKDNGTFEKAGLANKECVVSEAI